AADIGAGAEKVAAELRARAAGAKRVWIDLDADALDPAAMPAVQQALPLGLAAPTFLKLLDAAWAGKVVGLSVSEFDPGRDVRDAGLQLLGWLRRHGLLSRPTH